MAPRHVSLSIIATVLVVPLMAGCASVLNPLGGTDTFACKAPSGVTCTSVAGVYANAAANNLPTQRQRPATATPTTTAEAETASGGEVLPVRQMIASHTPGAGSAIRSDPRVVRIWLAPWEDAEGDLHDQAYIYITVDTGKWLIEHTRASLRRDFAPLKLRAQGEPPAPAMDKSGDATELAPTRVALPTSELPATTRSPLPTLTPTTDAPDAQ